MLGRKCLELKVLPKLPNFKSFSVQDFLCLIKYLRIVLDIDQDTVFIPSLLPVAALDISIDCHAPLLCFWLDEYKAVQILPQSFFHALIVEFNRREAIDLNIRSNQSRSTFVFDITLPNKKCRIVIVDHAFWLEVSIGKNATYKECQLMLNNIQISSKCVLQQLKSLSSHGDLQYGLYCSHSQCAIRLPHPGECVDTSNCYFECLETGNQWQEKNEGRLFWFQGL